MSEQIIVPALGESITEATVAKWLKSVGDTVEADEPIVELETDKVNLEVPSPISGTVGDIKFKDGDTVEVGAVLGSVQTNGHNLKKEEVEIKETVKSEEKNNISKLEPEKIQPKIFEKEDPIEIEDNENIDSDVKGEQPLILTNEITKEINTTETKINNNLSPSVRKIIAEKKIDISSVTGTGKDGRISKGDLINLMSVKPAPSERKIKFGEEEKIKMTRLRQTIAKRLKQAQENAALLTTFNEIDMSGIIEMRKENQEDFQKRYGVKLGFMSFFVKSCVLALKAFPIVNAEISGDEIIYKNYYNISFAVSTDKGLVVPVLKNANKLSFSGVESGIVDMVKKTQSKTLTIDDLTGGTFTITNGGTFGSMFSTPIINPPQVGILGMHAIKKKPVVIDDEVVVRPMMYLALTYDHRLVDGGEAVQFLVRIKDFIEDPQKLLIEN